jgi:hypothetical protein
MRKLKSEDVMGKITGAQTDLIVANIGIMIIAIATIMIVTTTNNIESNIAMTMTGEITVIEAVIITTISTEVRFVMCTNTIAIAAINQ